jgi:hypothetical protein
LTVLGPGNAPAIALPSGATSATAPLAPGPAGRVLALAEPADSHWTARLAGAALHPVERVGWAQSWALPTGGGALTVRYTDHLRALGLTWQGLALLVLVVLALPAAAARAQYDAEPAPVASGAGRHALGEEAVGESIQAATVGAFR